MLVASTQAVGSAPESTLDLAEPVVEDAKNTAAETLGLVTGALALSGPNAAD